LSDEFGFVGLTERLWWFEQSGSFKKVAMMEDAELGQSETAASSAVFPGSIGPSDFP
jgi:hypothetical protein